MFNEQWPSEDFGSAVLPAQYFESAKRSKLFEGEYRLLLAVLEDAVRSYLANKNLRNQEQRIRFAEVRRWFYPTGNAAQQPLFAFQSICDLLGIDASSFRKRLDFISIRDLPTDRRPGRRSLRAHPRRARSRRSAPASRSAR
jgi:hypothetical protein